MKHTAFFDCILTAEQPITHSEGNFGNISTIRRQKFALADGSVIQMPMISGNSIRHTFREAIMWHMLHTLGFSDSSEQKLGKAAVYFLFSGGALGESSNTIDVAQYRNLKDIIPAIGLFGGGIGNALLPGKLVIEHAIPLCEETVHQAASPIDPDVLPKKATFYPIYEYIDTFQSTRKELRGDPRMEKLMLGGEVRKQDLLLSEGKHNLQAGVKGDKGDSTQMIYHVECFCSGTRFFTRMGVQHATDLEHECFLTGLALWAQWAYAGGKKAVGFGKVKVEVQGMKTPIVPTESDNLPALQIGKTYIKHLNDKKEEILQILNNLN